jgi:RNA polymerase sigma-70 factor (ECF subfamily)
MNTGTFEDRLTALRPRLHRYCARMTGSTVDGEDVLQDALVKALSAQAEGATVDNLEAWLFRIAHNTALDWLRGGARSTVVPLTEEFEAPPMTETDVVAVSFHTFLRLPELQRCAVILKDVLGHSVDEIAGVSGCTPAAAKSALQRGRAALRRLAQMPADARLPLMSDVARQRMAAFVDLFRTGDFDAIRAMLADDVKLELVNRLKWQGRDKIAPYFTRYAQEIRWRFTFGAVEGRPAMLVFENGAMEKPAYFVLVDWRNDQISAIRDFLFAPYALESADWVQLGSDDRQSVTAGGPIAAAMRSIE